MSVYDDETHGNLQKTFQDMLNPQKRVVAESKVVEEKNCSDDDKKMKKEKKYSKKKKVVKENDDLDVGSKFNKIFKSVFTEQYDDEEELDMEFEDELPEVDGEDDYEFDDEEEMVSVPVAAIKELAAYLEDSMGAEDETDIENLDIELEESDNSGKPQSLPNKMGDTTRKGSDYQNDKTKTKGVGKHGHSGGNSKDKTGNPQKLVNILNKCLQHGKHYQKHVKVGKTPHKD